MTSGAFGGLISLLLICFSFIGIATAEYANIIASGATLLSGSSILGCEDPSDLSRTDCLGGLAAVDAYLRNYSNITNEPILYTPVLDRNTVFTQLHELDVSVNRKVLRGIFNYSRFAGTHSTLTSSRNMSYLQNEDLAFVLTNALVDPANSWLPFWSTVSFDSSTKIATISVQSGSQPNSFDSFSSTAAALVRVSRRANHDGPWLPVIAFDDQTIDFDEFVAFVSDRSRFETPAAVILKYQEAFNPYRTDNGTWVAGYSVSSNHLTHYRLTYTVTEATHWTLGRLEEVVTSDIRDLPAALKDHYYVTRQILLKQESVAAFANNPVVGKSGFMPVTRAGTTRRCFMGECEQGNLWTDAYRWATGADIAFEASGGMRGPGWEAGDVTVADIWSALPFANVLCTGTISGITLYRIMNFSTSKATFTSHYTEDGDLLMQVSGLKVVYNTALLTNITRLVSIQVWNSRTNSYQDIERLGLYRFVTNSFVCGRLEPYASMFTSALIDGELPGTLGDVNVQQILIDYFKALPESYNTTLSGRLSNDTRAEAMPSFVQTRNSCPIDTFWKASIETCVTCGEGFFQPESRLGESDCVASPAAKEEDSIIIGILVPSISIAAAVLVVLGYCFWRKGKQMDENLRDVSNAPTDGLITLFFTDIQSSTKLWSTCPLCMSAALEVHNQIIMDAVAKHQLYVVKNIGDAFFVGAKSPQAAVQCVVDIQRELMIAKFPRAIDAVYEAQTDDDLLDIEDDPQQLTSAVMGAPFHGIRIRVGLHVGRPEVKWDDNTKGYDYFGPPANIASRTEAAGRGGQILVTEHSLDYVDADHLDCTLETVGKCELKGVAELIELFELMPKEMTQRRIALRGISNLSPKKTALDQSHHSRLSHEVQSSSEEESETLDSVMIREDSKFLRSLLKAVRPEPRSQVMQILFSAWGVRSVGHQSTEDSLRALVKRVGRIKGAMYIQEEMRAMRSISAASPLSGSPMGPSLFSVKPVHGFSATGHQPATAADWSIGAKDTSIGEYTLPQATQVESINPSHRHESISSSSNVLDCSGATTHSHNMSSTSLPVSRPTQQGTSNPLGPREM